MNKKNIMKRSIDFTEQNYKFLCDVRDETNLSINSIVNLIISKVSESSFKDVDVKELLHNEIKKEFDDNIKKIEECIEKLINLKKFWFVVFHILLVMSV